MRSLAVHQIVVRVAAAMTIAVPPACSRPCHCVLIMTSADGGAATGAAFTVIAVVADVFQILA